MKQKSLELQLADLKIKQHEEKSQQEQSQMKIYADQVSQLLATEKNLRLQLTADGEKFQQFQVSLLVLLTILWCVKLKVTTPNIQLWDNFHEVCACDIGLQFLLV